jgi:hypothetical protein
MTPQRAIGDSVFSNFPNQADTARVSDVVEALDAMTGGRISAPPGPDNPWHVVKSSGLPGKAVTETPGLVLGDRHAAVRRLAVVMTVTEHDIELARAIGVDLIVAHHPVADAASAGGVALSDYLPRYGLSVIECHEAFHGLHPGIGYLHGHAPFFHHGSFGGVHGKVVMVGRPMAGVETLGDVLARIRTILSRDVDEAVLGQERVIRGGSAIADSVNAPGLRILHGDEKTALGNMVIHAFPHTGFSAADLSVLLDEHPETGTLVLSISSAAPEDELVQAAAHRGLSVIVGSSHATEILENGVPLAKALDELLPSVEVLLFRNRVVALPLGIAATGALADYGQRMADHLVRGALEGRAS